MEAREASREAVIDRLALSGEGVTGDGLRVSFALPGERIRVAELPEQPGAARVEAVLEAAPDRVTPPCPYFGACGGCALQHAGDEFLVRWKTEIVRRALAARGIPLPQFRSPHLSPPAARRRAVFAGRRTRSGAIVGYRAVRSHHIVAIETCPVSRPELLAARPALEAVTVVGGSRSAVLRLAVTLSDGGVDVAVEGGKPLDASLAAQLANLAETHNFARLSWSGEVVALRRAPFQRFGRALVVPPPGGFLQATEDGAAALVAGVREVVGPSRRVADLFAGAGTFALPLAEGAEVHAVEADAAALIALYDGWRGTPGLKRVATEARDLFRRPLLPDELAAFDAVVVDPPRAGAEKQSRALARSSVGLVAAVSCNPVSFARDAAILTGGGLRLDWVRLVDQFRWSPHVELVAGFSRG